MKSVQYLYTIFFGQHCNNSYTEEIVEYHFNTSRFNNAALSAT